MRFILYVAGMPFNGDTIKKGKSLGGSETAGYHIALELNKKGHEVTVFSNIKQEDAGKFDGVYYLPIGNKTDKEPLGENFERFARTVPHDVLVAQRIPAFFHQKFKSKINFWWSHDLALKRFQPQFNAQLWNVNKFLAVSKFHKEQIVKVYGLKESYVKLLRNGVDHELYSNDLDINQKLSSKTLVFSSRPERGLENLVKPDGIMERLFKIDPEIRLVVCGYENTTKETAAYYQMLWNRCNQLPNVEFYGAKSKEELATIEKNAWMQVYPTEFEETSCITAMNTQAAGLPFIASEFGALPETLKDGGVFWVDKEKGLISIENFVKKIIEIKDDPWKWKEEHAKALKKAESYSWSMSADSLVDASYEEFEDATKNQERMLAHFWKYTDILAARKYISKHGLEDSKYAKLIDDEYDFLDNKAAYKAHYKKSSDYNDSINNKHALGDDKRHLNMPRISPIINELKALKTGAKVLDYGCCCGQVSTALAKAFPGLDFVACDITKNQIDTAEAYRAKNDIKNIEFKEVSEPTELVLLSKKFDLVICGEVLEHVWDYKPFVNGLEDALAENGRIVFTTPSYITDIDKPFKEHVHHFEYQDVMDLWSKRKDFFVVYAPNYILANEKPDSIGGSFCYGWSKTEDAKNGEINYERKFFEQCPQETITTCIITKPDGDTLSKTLRSIHPICDDFIIGIDGDEEDGEAWNIAKRFGAEVFKIESPLKTGFDVARNSTIEKAAGDWVLWIDDDEDFKWPKNLGKLLRINQYDSYGVHQHHFSAEPEGIIKTDWPCRIFRTDRGIKFFGVVHEHPETEINKGCGHTFLTAKNDIAICHNGYDSEETRRKRFQRNWPLMIRDRKKYPTRELARFLWMRDLVHMNRFEIEQTNQITPEMQERAKEAISIWRDLLKEDKLRLVRESLDYYSEAVGLLTSNGGMNFETGYRANVFDIGDKINGSALPTYRAKFLDRQDVEAFSAALLKEKLDPLCNQGYL